MEDDESGLTRWTSSRTLAAALRDDPRFVEPVGLQLPGGEAGITDEQVEAIRADLYEEYGFAPQQVYVTRSAEGRVWSVTVDGEPVHTADTAPDQASVRSALARNLFRMLGPDDVAELLSFARMTAPTAVDSVIPHRVSLLQVRDVLRRLLRDDLPIKPLGSLVDAMGQVSPRDVAVPILVDAVRLARRRTICERAQQGDGRLLWFQLHLDAQHACGVLAHETGGGGQRVTRLRARLDEELRLAATHLSPVVVVAQQEHRAVVARMLRGCATPAVVLGDREMIDGDTRVGTMGAGIHVALPTRSHPPSGVWSTPAPADMFMAEQEHIVDVDVLE